MNVPADPTVNVVVTALVKRSPPADRPTEPTETPLPVQREARQDAIEAPDRGEPGVSRTPLKNADVRPAAGARAGNDVDAAVAVDVARGHVHAAGEERIVRQKA